MMKFFLIDLKIEIEKVTAQITRIVIATLQVRSRHWSNWLQRLHMP